MFAIFKMVTRQHFDINFVNVSTQLPHAVGAAYSLKMDKKNACAITYFGDGGTSEVYIKNLVLFKCTTYQLFM
jgi:TPP-dependent pyruvate/acetoin dehydrogenase alpha subunit